MQPSGLILDFYASAEQIYFGSAMNTLKLARSVGDNILTEHASVDWARALGELDAWDLGDEMDLDERAVRSNQDTVGRIAEQFSIFIQSVMNTDVFAVMTLEAYVNSVAASTLTGAVYDMIDRLSLDAKWLLLPRLLEKATFDPGKEPFQGLKRLVKRRNGLVHAKGAQRHLLLRGGQEARDFIEEHLDTADGTITTTKALIAELSKTSGGAIPSWIHDDNLRYYELRMESPRDA